MNILTTILFREHSKRLHRKNFRVLNGRPLVEWSVRQACHAALGDIVCSSDSAKELSILRDRYPVHLILRPSSLAGDDTPKMSSLAYTLLMMERKQQCTYDLVLDLDVTNPLRHMEDIFGIVDAYKKDNRDCYMSVVSSRRSPYFNQLIPSDVGYSLLPTKTYFRAQDTPKGYDLNCNLYLYERSFLLRCKGVFEGSYGLYEMAKDTFCDIDDEIDFKLVGALCGRYLK
jgi:CMP-N,N'-diacetyllegionaminic acid synthase